MRRTAVMIAVAALTLGPAARPSDAGAASDYQRVLQVYERVGSIPPCQFTAAALQTALGGIDTYGAQYFADFTQAVQAALSARAGGACVAGGASPASSPGPAPASVPPPPGGSLTAATSAGVPLPLALLGGAAVIGAIALGARATARRARARAAR
jgi:hypothetical protein